MDSFDYQTWGLLLAVLASQGILFRWVLLRMRKDSELSVERDNVLHGRINDVKDNYVRRADLDAHLDPLKLGQKDLKESLDRLHSRFDAFLTSKADRVE